MMDANIADFMRHGRRPDVDAVQIQSSALSLCLLTLFGWDILSANQVQWIASCAVADGLLNHEVKRISKIRTEGMYAGNARRDLRRFYGPQFKIAPPLKTISVVLTLCILPSVLLFTDTE